MIVTSNDGGSVHFRRSQLARLRLQAYDQGFQAMQDKELLALVICHRGSKDPLEQARSLLAQDGLLGLGSVRPGSHTGLTPTTSVTIAALVELFRRFSTARRPSRPSLRSPEAVCEAIGPQMALLDHEELWVLPLDSRSRLIGHPLTVSRGDVDGTDAGPQAFFRLALRVGAVGAIAVHNHPSGCLAASPADRAVTERLIQAGRTLDVVLADHVILGDAGRFTSLRRDMPGLWR